jgi:hypothetical protein
MNDGTPVATAHPNPRPARVGTGRRRIAKWIAFACTGLVVVWGTLVIIGFVNERRYRIPVPFSSQIRQIAQASLIYASAHEGRLPPSRIAPDGRPSDDCDAMIHAVAALLAREGGLNETWMWFTPTEKRGDRMWTVGRRIPVIGEDGRVEPTFLKRTIFAWDFATGLSTDLPPTTPIVWTRGLRPDGTWDPEGAVWGSEGGYIAFLGGNVMFCRELRSTPLVRPDGTPTSNILETLPTTARIVGSGPATQHGMHGLVER